MRTVNPQLNNALLDLYMPSRNSDGKLVIFGRLEHNLGSLLPYGLKSGSLLYIGTGRCLGAINTVPRAKRPDAQFGRGASLTFLQRRES
jgi:hypothetical protein